MKDEEELSPISYSFHSLWENEKEIKKKGRMGGDLKRDEIIRSCDSFLLSFSSCFQNGKNWEI